MVGFRTYFLISTTYTYLYFYFYYVYYTSEAESQIATYKQKLSKYLHFKHYCPNEWTGVNYKYFIFFVIHYQWKLDILLIEK